MAEKSSVINLGKRYTSAAINSETGELFSFARSDLNVMWEGGAPAELRPKEGRKFSEFVMFPIVGQAIDDKGIKDSLVLGDRRFTMGKHGIARHVHWDIESATDTQVVATQTYDAFTGVPGKSMISVFPLSYKLTKTYCIDDNDEGRSQLFFTLEIENRSDDVLPYAVGWHPTFKAYEGASIDSFGGPRHNSIVYAAHLEDIRTQNGDVQLYKNANIMYYSTCDFRLSLEHDFPWGIQVWNSGDGLLGLEPISNVSLSKGKRGGGVNILKRDDYRKLMRKGDKETFKAKIELYDY
ncbi:MAG: hypothetical protein ABR981_00430 [Candidatus Micrarchaeaceae archaeon]